MFSESLSYWLARERNDRRKYLLSTPEPEVVKEKYILPSTPISSLSEALNSEENVIELRLT